MNIGYVCKYFIVSVLLILVGSSTVYSQKSQKGEYRLNNYFDIATSFGSGKFAAALAWSHLHGIGKKEQRFKIGYGVRFTSFTGANKYYTTAPASLTSTSQGPGTIFSDDVVANIDTITTATTLTNSLNGAIYFQYNISSKFDVGFNIDAIGFSFGPEKQFNVISSSFDPGQSPIQKGSPTSFNLLLISDNDIGSLNSELYLRYWITKKIGIRAGYTFLFSEYKTNQNLSFDGGRIENDRYRYKASMALIAISYKPFNKN